MGFLYLPQSRLLLREAMTREAIARAVVTALYEEGKLYWESTGAEQTRYRNLVRMLAMAQCDQITDSEFKAYLVSIQPIFKDAEQSRRDFVANYYSDPATIKAMAEATKKMQRELEGR